MSDLTKICKATEGHIYRHVDGFYDVFFHNKPWYQDLKTTIERSNPEILQRLASRGSTISLEKLNTHIKTLNMDQPRQYHGLVESHQTSFWLAEDRGRGSGVLEYSKVLMIGEIDDKDDPRSYPLGLANMISLAEHVFEAQPTRRFLHAVYIRGCVAEPWLLDRMGLYSGQPFDLSKEEARLATLLSGYTMMSNVELGMDTLICEDEGKKFICLSNKDSERLVLETEPFVSPRQLLGKGVTCYKARVENSDSWKAVLKFSWQSEKEEKELEILRLVKERKVWGVIQLIDHGNVESMANIHHGLTLSTPRKLLATSKGELTGGMSLIDSQTIYGHSEPLLEQRHTSEESRVLSYTITSPYGRHITEYSNINEFLVVLRDAIKAHRSLYTIGGILHQDISINNIIITEAATLEESHGTLIDLDAAIEVAAEKPLRKTITGTKPFMAIGLLQGEDHAYWHDLESFFYVLLFCATIDRKVGLPADTPLQKWMGGSWDELAVRKASDLADPKFDQVLAGFQPDFEALKGLARALRNIIIGNKVSTEDEGSQLCEQILAAFDETIALQYKANAQI